jgi:hypothetical protein
MISVKKIQTIWVGLAVPDSLRIKPFPFQFMKITHLFHGVLIPVFRGIFMIVDEDSHFSVNISGIDINRPGRIGFKIQNLIRFKKSE